MANSDSANPGWFEKGDGRIWYPYTQMRRMAEPLQVTGAEGCVIHTRQYGPLIDGCASWWSAAHGYNHPHITEAIQQQAGTLHHVMLAGCAHEQAYVLADRLCSLTGMSKVFFTDSGSTAVETAMKAAVQYHANKGDARKCKFLSFSDAYHGDTMGCMSLCDPDRGMHAAFRRYMPHQFSVPLPADEYAFAELDAIFADIAYQTAAAIIEPLIQGAGGMLMHGPDVVAEIARLCRKHNILLIADEVMTGFYRTGSRFACEEAGITPDILCLGKALSGGAVTLAAMLATEEVFAAFDGDDNSTALMSGPTYMANPIACAAANASLDLFEQSDYAKKVSAIEKIFFKELNPLEDLPGVREVRIRGAAAAVECGSMQWEDLQAMRARAPELGVFLRPFSNIIYAAPPLVIAAEELKRVTDAIRTLTLGKVC